MAGNAIMHSRQFPAVDAVLSKLPIVDKGSENVSAACFNTRGRSRIRRAKPEGLGPASVVLNAKASARDDYFVVTRRAWGSLPCGWDGLGSGSSGGMSIVTVSSPRITCSPWCRIGIGSPASSE
jgi:hypothetical protein